jgi:hypothetical protein
LSNLTRLQYLVEPFSLRLVVTADQHLIAGGDSVEFLAQFGQGAGETLDGLDSQMACRFDRSARKGGDLDVGEAHKLLEDPRGRKKTASVRHAFQVMLALLEQIVRLDKDGPASGRQKVGQMATPFAVAVLDRPGERVPAGDPVASLARPQVLRRRPIEVGRHELALRQIRGAPLGLQREMPNRFDLVTEELKADRRIRVGRKNVYDATAPAEVARQLHRIVSVEPVVNEPAG